MNGSRSTTRRGHRLTWMLGAILTLAAGAGAMLFQPAPKAENEPVDGSDPGHDIVYQIGAGDVVAAREPAEPVKTDFRHDIIFDTSSCYFLPIEDVVTPPPDEAPDPPPPTGRSVAPRAPGDSPPEPAASPRARASRE